MSDILWELASKRERERDECRKNANENMRVLVEQVAWDRRRLDEMTARALQAEAALRAAHRALRRCAYLLHERSPQHSQPAFDACPECREWLVPDVGDREEATK